MLYNTLHNRWLRIVAAVVGELIAAAALNLFIVPLNLYTGGIMGVCQLIRTFLQTLLGVTFGAYDIAGGADAVVAWEFRKTAEHGTIICIGSGCYDWYTVADPGEYTSYYHENIAKITENAFNYLKQ